MIKLNLPNLRRLKTRLRAEKLLERINHHPEEKKARDRSICERLKRLSVFKNAHNILSYMPIHGEVDLHTLFSGKYHSKKLVLPRVKDSTTLDLHEVEDPSNLKPGKFRIPEPGNHHPKMAPDKIDLVLVPGIVFSQNGHRIGYGKGFYDRLLKKTICPKIGIAYEFQMVENISGEPHDIPMDMIVTEKKTHHIKKP